LKGWLLDTNVLSLFAPERPPVRKDLAEWLEQEGAAGTLYVPVVAIAEIKRGILKLARKGGNARASLLDGWLQKLLAVYGDRILPIDAAVALAAGQIEDAAESRGQHPGFADVLIAATAQVHGLTVVSNNARHFEALGAPLKAI
jgi:hypothetical protein